MTNQRQTPEIGLQWAAPPVKKLNGRGRQPNAALVAIAAELRKAPGEWGRVAAYASGSSASALSGRIGKGKAPWGPAGEFESISRAGIVYARFVGASADQVEQTPDYSLVAPIAEAAHEAYVGPGPMSDSGDDFDWDAQ